MTFALSHSLFSGFDIDHGTRLLLKTIAGKIDLSKVGSILDIGSGVGVLGIALKRLRPDALLHSADRDALALAFTSHNAARNGITDCITFGSVGLMHLPDRKYDLVVSNIPAKAGNKAISGMISGASSLLESTGTLACVIVPALAVLVQQAVAESSGTIVYRENTQSHAVFHVTWQAPATPDRSIEPYVRGKARFVHESVTYEMKTVFGIPEFDTLNYSTGLLMEAMEGIHFKGNLLVWNPGQGHIPVYAYKKGALGNASLSLCSRDLLGLEISKRNCVEAGMDEKQITVNHLPSIFDITGVYDYMIVDPDKDPGSPWYKHFLDSVFSHLSQGGLCAIVSKSSLVFQILKGHTDIKVIKDSRDKGFRVVIVKKRQ